MAKVLAYSVLDEKAATFSPPFFMANKALAHRMFGELALDPKSNIARHPADYRLYEVGSFDQEAGLLEGYDAPQFVCAAIDFLEGRKVEAPSYA